MAEQGSSSLLPLLEDTAAGVLVGGFTGAITLLGERRRHRLASYAIGCIAAYIAVKLRQAAHEQGLARKELLRESARLLARLQAGDVGPLVAAPRRAAPTELRTTASQTDPVALAATSTAPRLLPPPITPVGGMMPPALAAGPPPPPPPPPPLCTPRGLGRSTGGLPNPQDLASALGGLRKAAGSGGAGGATPLAATKREAANLAGAKALGISLDMLSSVTLKAAAKLSPKLRPATPEALAEAAKLRSRLQAKVAAAGGRLSSPGKARKRAARGGPATPIAKAGGRSQALAAPEAVLAASSAAAHAPRMSSPLAPARERVALRPVGARQNAAPPAEEAAAAAEPSSWMPRLLQANKENAAAPRRAEAVKKPAPASEAAAHVAPLPRPAKPPGRRARSTAWPPTQGEDARRGTVETAEEAPADGRTPATAAAAAALGRFGQRVGGWLGVWADAPAQTQHSGELWTYE